LLHILNGDAVLETFSKSGVGKRYAIWRELYCQGPTMLDLYELKSLELRQSFFKSFFKIPEDKYFRNWKSQLDIIRLDSLEKVMLWFEYDLFCQFNMMAAIYFIDQLNKNAQIFIVNVGKSLDDKEWITLGHLDAEDWSNLYQKKKQLSKEDKDWMCHAWEIYCSAAHKDFDQIVDTCPSVFKYFPQAIENHYRRFHSSIDGLTDIQRYIIEKLQKEDGMPRSKLLKKLTRHFHYYGYGNLQYQAMLAALYFVELKNDKYFLTFSTDQKIDKLRVKLPNMQYGGMSNKAAYLEEFIEL
jgi:hypothetical protein